MFRQKLSVSKYLSPAEISCFGLVWVRGLSVSLLMYSMHRVRVVIDIVEPMKSFWGQNSRVIV